MSNKTEQLREEKKRLINSLLYTIKRDEYAFMSKSEEETTRMELEQCSIVDLRKMKKAFSEN